MWSLGTSWSWDYSRLYKVVYCINLTNLFEPCGKCADGKKCRFANGQSKCVYECRADEVGGGQQPCTQDAYDTRARSSLMSIEADPWEQGEAYSCVNGTVTVGSSRTNKSNYLYTDYPTNSQKNPNAGDVCTLSMAIGAGGGGHSHPHFVWPRDKGVQCLGALIESKEDVDDYNAANVNFSSNDKNAARGANNGDGRPLYLVVPNRNCVKVYRKNEKDRWQQSGCL